MSFLHCFYKHFTMLYTCIFINVNIKINTFITALNWRSSLIMLVNLPFWLYLESWSAFFPMNLISVITATFCRLQKYTLLFYKNFFMTLTISRRKWPGPYARLRHMLKNNHQASLWVVGDTFLKLSFALFSRGYSFHLCCFGN